MHTTNLSFALCIAKTVLALNALGVFFFDFVQIGTERTSVTLRGFDLTFGTSDLPDAIADVPQFWAMLLLLVYAVQFLLVVFWYNRMAIWFMITVSILILVMLQIDFIALWQSEGVSVLFGYWLAFGISLGIALCQLVENNFRQVGRHQKQHLHINIFTERKEVKRR